ncbi:MAG: hypothetical protein SYC29_13020 [Planctomycetota bacterium]|nr:hypothetical protein [Planctomycetota bacterium]
MFTLFVAALMMPHSLARAQGTRGILPDPISHRDVDRYADGLEASAAQREGLARIHDSYLAGFRALRDGPIERFLTEHPRAVSFHARMPADRAEAELEARALDELAGRIRQLDDGFFGDVREILTEAQAAELPRLERDRQRTRYRQGPAFVTRSPYLLADLAILVDELELDAKARQTVRPLVEEYERRFLAALKRLDDVTSALRLEMLRQRRVHEAAIRQGNLWEHTIVKRAIFEKLAALTGELAEIHRHALRQCSAVLPGPAADALHRRFCAIVYPDLPPGLGPAGELFDRLLAGDSITGEQRSSIEMQRAVYREAARRLKEQMFDVIDALRASSASHRIQFRAAYDSASYYEDAAEYGDRIAELRTELDRVNQSAARALATITGEAHDVPRIAREKPKEPGRSLRLGVAAPHGVDGPRIYSYRNIPLEQLILQFGSGATRFLPDPIPGSDLERYARRLDLDADDEAVLAELHAMYLDRYRKLGVEGPIARVQRLQRTLFQRDAAGRIELPSVRQIERLFDLRRQALPAILALDAQFHDDLVTVWGDVVESVVFERLQRDRLRAVYRLAVPGSFVPGLYRPLLTIGPRERKAHRDAERITIEPAEIVETACGDLQPDVFDEVQAVVIEAEVEVTALLEELFEARLEMEQERARLLASRLAHDEDGTLNAVDVQPTEAILRLDERIHQTLREIRALNRAARDAIAARLPESERWAFQAAYRRAGYPSVYDDADRVHDILSAATRLDDLDPRQREQLDELSRTYRLEFERCARRIIASRNDWRARQRHEAERDELNTRTRLRLKEILGPDRLEALSRRP